MTKCPWLRMWVDPRDTIKEIVAKDPKYCFKTLSGFYGFPVLLHFAQTLSLGATHSLGAILIIALVLSPFVGMLGISITSALIFWTGKWIGGKGIFPHIRAAVTWSNVTSVVTSLFWLILVGTFGVNVFYREFPNMPFTGSDAVLVSFIFLLQFIISVWSLVLLCKGLGQVQKFSAWKGLLNVIIPFVLFVIFVWVVMLIIGASVGGMTS
jgi:hypothetical protein